MRACRLAGSCPAGRQLSFSHFAARASPSFPLGGRRHSKAVTDEEADFGLGSLYAGGDFAAPAVSYFLPERIVK